MKLPFRHTGERKKVEGLLLNTPHCYIASFTMTSFAMCRSMKCDLYYIYMLYMFIATSTNFTFTYTIEY